jgi:predicted nucleic acid-binding protein
VALNLIDTAVWVDWLKDRDNAVTARLVELRRDPESPATTQPVVMEVLQYLNSAAADRVERILDSLVMLSVDPGPTCTSPLIHTAPCANPGHTVRSSIDTLIAAVAIQRDAVLVHKDKDFDRIAAVVPRLRVERLHD